MNSFRFLERGIAAELERQVALLEAGSQVEQETFHFDPRTGSLTPLRSKEYAHDYRYFPEPDLVPLAPTEEMLRTASEALARAAGPAARALPGRARAARGDRSPACVRRRARRLFRTRSCGLRARARLRRALPRATTIANWVTGELVGRLREGGDGEVEPGSSKVSPEALAALAGMVEAKQVTTGAARQVLATLVAEGGDPAEIVDREGLAQMSDTGRARGDRRARDRGGAGRRREGPGRQPEGDRPDRRRRDARDKGPSGRGRGDSSDHGEAGR